MLLKNNSILLALFISLSLYSFDLLPKDYWWILETTSELSAYDEETKEFYWQINFSEQVKKLDGQKITLKGYFYNYQDTAITLFTKNKQPFYGCGADPKVMMVEIKELQNLDFKPNKRYTIEGVLQLNQCFHQTTSYTFPYRITDLRLKTKK